MGVDVAPMEHVSHSQLSSWLECGKKYYFAKVARIPEPPAWWSLGGSAVHEATADLEVEMLFSGDMPEFQQIRNMFVEKLTEEIEKATEKWPDLSGWRAAPVPKTDQRMFGPRQEEKWWVHHGPVYARRWLTWAYQTTHHSLWQVPDTQAPAVEIALRPRVGESQTEVVMYIDRVYQDRYGRLLVLDGKTGKNKVASTTQLGIYAAGLRATYGRDLGTIEGSYFYARDGAITDPVKLSIWTPAYLGHLVDQFVRARQHEIYLPNPGRDCWSRCGFMQHCVAMGGYHADKSDPDYKYTEVI